MTGAAAVSFAVCGAAALAWLGMRRRREWAHGYDAAWVYRSKRLANCVVLVRHGQSEANVADLISSDPAVGTVEHSLTSRGELQASRAAQLIAGMLAERRAEFDKDTPVVVFCSDFTRTRRTAGIIAKDLGLDEASVTPCEALRERHFGDLDGTSCDNYQKVWDHDNRSAHHTEYKCESVASVMRRAADKIVQLDAAHANKLIVVVAHGDVLQIARTAFDGAFPPARHREGTSLQTGSVTEVKNQALIYL